MTHARTTIRNAIKTLLDDGTIVASGKVYTNRVISITEPSLPNLNIVQGPETSQRPEFGSEDLRRNSSVVVEAIVSSSNWDTIDDDMDALAEKIETKIKGDSSLGETVHDIYLSRSEPIEVADGGKPIGRMLMTFTVEYFD